MNEVKLVKGTQAQYNAFTTKDEDTLYFITDTQKIYKGSHPYTKVEFVDTVPTTDIEDGLLYCVTDEFGVKIFTKINEELKEVTSSIHSLVLEEGEHKSDTFLINQPYTDIMIRRENKVQFGEGFDVSLLKSFVIEKTSTIISNPDYQIDIIDAAFEDNIPTDIPLTMSYHFISGYKNTEDNKNILMLSSGIQQLMPHIEELSTQLPVPLSNCCVASMDDYVYILGGITTNGVFVDDIHQYNVKTKQLEPEHMLNHHLPVSVANAYCAKVKFSSPDTPDYMGYEAIYVLGGQGYEGKNRIFKCYYKYNPETGSAPFTVEELPVTLPVPMSGGACAAIGTDIYLFGGSDTNKIYKFDALTNEISEIGEVNFNWRFWAGGTASTVGNQIYLFGGKYSNTEEPDVWYNSSIYVFDHSQPSAPSVRGTYQSTAISSATVGQDIYIFGGNRNLGTSAVVKYDTVTGRISNVNAALPQSGTSAGLFYTGSTAVGTDIYVIGGQDGFGGSRSKFILRLPTVPSNISGLLSRKQNESNKLIVDTDGTYSLNTDEFTDIEVVRGNIFLTTGFTGKQIKTFILRKGTKFTTDVDGEQGWHTIKINDSESEIAYGGVDINEDLHFIGYDNYSPWFVKTCQTWLEIPGPELLSWEGVLARISSGTYATDYHIGDLIPLDLEGDTVDMEVVGIDTDELSDGTGNSHITFISKQLLNTTHTMNDTDTNTGGWGQSGMRTYLNDTIKPLIPETVRNAIKEVKKYSYSHNPNNPNLVSNDTVWIPSVREVGGTYMEETLGPVYSGVFNNSRVKHKVGGTVEEDWWLRSASHDYLSSFWSVNFIGSMHDVSGAIHSGGVALGFCL